MRSVLVAAAICLFGIVYLAGCNGQPAAKNAEHDDHAHDHKSGVGHAHPESFAGAVTEVVELRDAIRDAFAKKQTEDADKKLHTIGHLLDDDLPPLAKKAGLAAADLEAVNKAIKDLFDLYGKVDENLHGGKGSSYDDVSKQIDAAVELLQKHTAKK